MNHRWGNWLAGVAIAFAWQAFGLGADSPGSAPPAGSAAAADSVELRGRVVCITEVLHQRYGTELTSEHSHVYALQTTNGAFYTLLPTRFSEALLSDARVRERELILNGRIFPKSQILEVTRTRSVREGVVYDLYYYCSVCSIETVSPGLCACCQGVVELTERPWRERSAGANRSQVPISGR